MRTEKLAQDKLALFTEDNTLLGYFELRDGTWYLRLEVELTLEEVKDIGKLKLVLTPYRIEEDIFFTNFNTRHQPGVFKVQDFIRMEESSFGCTAIVLYSHKGEYTKYCSDTMSELTLIMEGGEPCVATKNGTG